jgi:ribonucleoside-diphosphate reductase subunit M1
MITPNLQDKKLAEEEEEDLQAKMAQVTCSLNNREDCLACGS